MAVSSVGIRGIFLALVSTDAKFAIHFLNKPVTLSMEMKLTVMSAFGADALDTWMNMATGFAFAMLARTVLIGHRK